MDINRRKTGLGRLIEIAGTKRWLLIGAMSLAVITAIVQFVPIIAVYNILIELAKHALDPSLIDKAYIWQWGYICLLYTSYNYSDNNYKMKSPFQEGLTITRDHDKFKKAVVGGSFKARKWWFDLVEFEPVFIHTYKDVQGIESNIQYAHSHSDAFIIANKMEKENFLLEGLDFDWQLGYVYTSYHFTDTASRCV